MSADLRWVNAPGSASGVVLVFHGGASLNRSPVRWFDHAVLRLVPIAWAASRGNRSVIAVALLKNDVVGWNGASASPLSDARRALDTVSERYPGMPIGLVGHSMGGRVAHQIMGDARVTSVLGLAAWIDPVDRLSLRPDQRLLFAHAPGDRLTDPARTEQWARQLAVRGGQASYLSVRGGDHPLLRRAGVWHDIVTAWCALTVADAEVPRGVDAKVAAVVSAAASGAVIGEV